MSFFRAQVLSQYVVCLVCSASFTPEKQQTTRGLLWYQTNHFQQTRQEKSDGGSGHE